MKTQMPLRVRRSILELQRDYEAGNKKPLQDLMRAWKGIKELPYTDEKSFFKLGGFHGEPFRGPGTTDSAYWGGYCNHGNVLFPTWHRVYLYKLEEALQSIPGCEEVMLPYWDETDEYSLNSGIPWALTVENFELDGAVIPNPLRSFVFPVAIKDKVVGDESLYSKPAGYETVRYPLSGLVGTPEAQQQTAEHNAKYPDYNQNVSLLNGNVLDWLNNPYYYNSAGQARKAGVHEKFERCLDAPNYTVFSNTTSQGEWNDENPGETPVVSLESPHNDIHLAVGGFDVPGQGNISAIAGANGDMGENDTAGLDPIFYFHHCNIDRVFWLWQKKHGKTDALDVIPFYPGTNSSDSQGPVPGVPPNTILDMDTPLYPFMKQTAEGLEVYKSTDCINIEEQLGFTYSKGSLEERQETLKAAAGGSVKSIYVSGISRAPIQGSFVIEVYANVAGERVLVGYESVLSRWNVMRCSNCQTHLEVKTAFGLQGFEKGAEPLLENLEVLVRKRTQDEPTMFKSELSDAPRTPKIEIR